MENLLYRIINPPVTCLLRSPFHVFISKNTLLLEFTGRKSGRALSTPISSYISGQVAHCFTSQSSGWWRNMMSGAPVYLTIKGVRYQSIPVVEVKDDELKMAQLDAFLRAVPRDAAHAGVGLDDRGNPDCDDMCKVLPSRAYLKFPLQNVSD